MVTIVFSDLVGSTTLGESLDPEALREVLNRYFDEMRACLERHGGIVEKYIGDAVMAVFGLPRAHEDDALRALRAAVEMRSALAALNEELDRGWSVRLTNRTGVHTGEVVTGDPATGQRLVTGDAVNTAARLEQAAPHGEILVGEPTYRLVRDGIDAESVHPVPAKGKAEPVAAFRLVSVTGAEPVARHADVEMVGRTSELGLLLEAFRRARDGRRCVLVTVVGEAGVGKTRLVSELLARVRDHARIGGGRCLSYGEGITYWPLSQAVRQIAEIDDADTRDVALAKLGDLCRGAPDAGDIVDRVATAMGLADVPFSKEEIAWGFRKIMERVAADEPLALVLDDIQWAEPTLLEAVGSIASRAAGVSLLFVCMARPELELEPDGWLGGVADQPSMRLEPLSDEEGGSLVEAILGGTGIPVETVTAVLEVAQGNPLFLEQMLAKWQDDGILRLGETGWRLSTSADALTVPPSIHALLAARLDGLGTLDRAVLERGSIVGQVFPRAAVEAMSAEELRPGVGRSLGTLERRRLVRPDGASSPEDPTFAFVHLLVRDAVYSAMLKRLKSELHERFADWLVARAGDRLAEVEEIVGYHLEQAFGNLAELGPPGGHAVELRDRAARHLLACAHRAFGTNDMRAASSLFDRAIALLPDGHDRLCPALLDLSTALMLVGEFDRSRSVLMRAEELARSTEDARGVVLARLARGQIDLLAVSTISADELRSRAMEAIEVFRPLGDDRGLERAFHLLGETSWLEARLAEAEEAFTLAVSHAERAGDERAVRENLLWIVTAAFSGPIRVEEGLRRCSEVMHRSGGDRLVQAFAKLTEGGLLAMAGEFERARDCIRESRGVYEDLGWVAEEAASTQLSGIVEMLAGDLTSAERELRRGCEILERIGELGYLSTSASLLAAVLAQLARLDEADRYISMSIETGSLDDRQTQAEWRIARGEVLIRRGDTAPAVAIAREAVEWADRTDLPNVRGNARILLATTLRSAGATAEASKNVRLALAEFERKGNLVSAGRARELLAELAV